MELLITFFAFSIRDSVIALSVSIVVVVVVVGIVVAVVAVVGVVVVVVVANVVVVGGREFVKDLNATRS